MFKLRPSFKQCRNKSRLAGAYPGSIERKPPGLQGYVTLNYRPAIVIGKLNIMYFFPSQKWRCEPAHCSSLDLPHNINGKSMT
ncbi:hypothetical protein NPIL_213851 [Nephila pilipes]|uniref:Uncharacterized protein n=1 Tax=Nephila pilipes TaxID=299642 RepID=A0A8X6P5B3_NEPPI|nr:hypothetical protein NPIL_213851 [Nephila pilipes]